MNNMDKIVSWFQLSFPNLVHSMKQTSHHGKEYFSLNPYHLEGDVFCHTMMVCKQAENLSEPLQLAALLHDVGKPSCREQSSDKKVHFYGHEGMSAIMTRDILHQYGNTISNKDLQLIIEIIALHTEPFKLSEKELTKRMVNNKNLMDSLLAVNRADQAGRFSFNGNDVKQFEEPRDIYPEQEQTLECIMYIGLPCSGKSTLANTYGKPVLSRDTILEENTIGSNYNEKFQKADQRSIDKLFQKQLSELIRNKESFVVDKTNLSRKSRRRVLSQLPKHYKKTAVVCMPRFSEILRRNGERHHKHLDIKTIEYMAKRFYPPLYDEFDSISWNFDS